jgi:SAM-dependent methyltransferase
MRSPSPDAHDAEPVTTPIQAIPPATVRPALELFLISFLILFLELACIRWLGSVVIFLTYFTNIVLMACFLGVSVGCLASARRYSWIGTFFLLALLITASASGSLWIYERAGQIMVDVGSQQSPQLIYFGTELRLKDPSKWVIPIEVLAGYFFALVALLFLGLGQEMGRRFAIIENRLLAYSADILGSLAGIAAFAAMSFFRLPAYVWFAITFALGVYFVPRRRLLHAIGGLGALALVAWADWPVDAKGVATEVLWSPYYQVRFKPRYMSIDVNNIGHQGMQRVDQYGAGYFSPYLMNRDAGGKPIEDVLIIGAGSGNDVAAALANGVKHVDAVEIDPVINEIGRLHHPNKPYSDPRVTIHLTDGRGFLRQSRAKYDLIVYALVDSLALHSSYSSVRLESFLFTEQAIRDVRAHLKPDGFFVMYNSYRQGWLVGRLAKLAEQAFTAPPIVFSVLYRAVIKPDDNLRDHVTILLAGDAASNRLGPIRARFAAGTSFLLYRVPALNFKINGFEPPPPTESAEPPPLSMKIAPARVEPPVHDHAPTDLWPFLYLKEPAIPALNLRGMAIVAVLSLIILMAFAPVRRVRLSGTMFFLGAGFMLLETKGVVHMALLFGSTWVVNSIVFFAILAMILMSNLYVMAVRPRRLWPYFGVLLASLLINVIVPMDTYLALPGLSKVIVSCLVVYLPVFFAGVIFGTVFRSSTQPDVDFGSNVGGIILGGLTEYLSLIFGFNALIGIAIGYYALSALFLRRGRILASPT